MPVIVYNTLSILTSSHGSIASGFSFLAQLVQVMFSIVAGTGTCRMTTKVFVHSGCCVVVSTAWTSLRIFVVRAERVAVPGQIIPIPPAR